jgi:hypothetical protein
MTLCSNFLIPVICVKTANLCSADLSVHRSLVRDGRTCSGSNIRIIVGYEDSILAAIQDTYLCDRTLSIEVTCADFGTCISTNSNSRQCSRDAPRQF